MHLFAFGINHQSAPLDVRERLVFQGAAMGAALRDLVAVSYTHLTLPTKRIV